MGLASSKPKLKLIDIKFGAKRAQARSHDALSEDDQNLSDDAQNLSDDVQSLKARKTGRRRKDATKSDAGTEIGTLLRNAREQSEQNLVDISDLLRIRRVYLQAIEDGEFKTLPGMTYAIGYVRSYAQHLDLDVDRAIALFKSEAQELDQPRQLVFPSPAPEGKVPGGAIMFVAALLAVAAYTGWYQLSNSGTSVSEYASEIPESLQSWLDQKSTDIASSDGFTSAAVASSPASEENGSGTDQEPGQLMENDRASTASKHVSAPEPAAAPEVTTVKPLAPVVVAATVPMTAASGEAASGTSSQSVAFQAAVSPQAATQDVAAATAPDAPSLDAVAPNNIAASDPAPLAPNGVASAEPSANVSADTPIDPTGTAVSATSAGPSANQAAPVQVTPVQVTPVQVASIPAAPATLPRGQTQAAAARPESTASQSSGQSSGQSGAQTGLPEQTGVIIHANADSWVQVRAADSTTIMTRVMRAGDSYRVPDRDGLRLFTGNAGALTIEVDGEVLPKIGGLGQIARNVDLEPGILKRRVN